MSFFFKQKTAYEMRISDWSSDVCSSDLVSVPLGLLAGPFTLLCLLGFQNAVNMADGTNGLVIGLGLGWVSLLLLHAPPELTVFLWLLGAALLTTLPFNLAGRQIGRAHVRTHVTNAHLVCRLLLGTKKTQ